MNKIFHGNSLTVLTKLTDNSVDLICTDPPYGIGFLGSAWDTFNPETVAKDVEVSKRKDGDDKGFASPALSAARYDHSPQGARRFRDWFYDVSVELLRVLKPGAFAFVCIGARQDSVSAVIRALTDAGFKTDFTSLYWTYASGFPKALNIGKALHKRARVKRGAHAQIVTGAPASTEAKALDGSYGGFQPKPAVEAIVVAMKPLSAKTFVDQALTNGKGITWLDDCRIPTSEFVSVHHAPGGTFVGGAPERGSIKNYDEETRGRFPANLLVSDEVLGEYSRFFALPFIIVSKASRGEKNSGLSGCRSARYRRSCSQPHAIQSCAADPVPLSAV